MRLVIEIPDGYDVTRIQNGSIASKVVLNAVKNGTPLPKGHGRLIDADELKKTIQENDVLNMTGFNVRLCDINNTPTIIEADNAESEVSDADSD